MRILFTSHALDPVSHATLLPIHEVALLLNDRGYDVICFSLSRWAASFFEKKTSAYKLGRECQEIWRKTDDPKHQDRYTPPISIESKIIESHRVMDTVRKAYPNKIHLEATHKELRRIEKEGGHLLHNAKSGSKNNPLRRTMVFLDAVKNRADLFFIDVAYMLTPAPSKS